MDKQDYPRMLYRGAEQTIVDDADGEDAARADGFVGYDERDQPAGGDPGNAAAAPVDKPAAKPKKAAKPAGGDPV